MKNQHLFYSIVVYVVFVMCSVLWLEDDLLPTETGQEMQYARVQETD